MAVAVGSSGRMGASPLPWASEPSFPLLSPLVLIAGNDQNAAQADLLIEAVLSIVIQRFSGLDRSRACMRLIRKLEEG